MRFILILNFAILIGFTSHAQTVSWLLEPTITSCNEIIDFHEGSRLVICRDDYKDPRIGKSKSRYKSQHVKNFDNFTIIKPSITEFSISIDGEYIYNLNWNQHHTRQLYNKNGLEIEYPSKFEFFHPPHEHNNKYDPWQSKYLNRISKIEKLSNTICKKKLKDNKVLFDFISTSGDTLFKDLSHFSVPINDALVYSDRFFYDLKGKKLNKEKSGYHLFNNTSLLTHNGSKKLFNNKLELLFESDERIELINNSDLIITSKWRNKSIKSLYDYKTQNFIVKDASEIEKNFKQDWLLIVKGDSTHFYNLKDKSYNTINATDASFEKGKGQVVNSNVCRIKWDGLYGVYDYLQSEYILEPQFEILHIKENHIIAKLPNEENYQILNKSNGKIIVNGISKIHTQSHEEYICYTDSTTSYLVNTNNKVIYKDTTWFLITDTKKHWILFSYDGINPAKIKFININDLVNNNPTKYSYVSPSVSLKNDSVLYIVGNQKYWIVNQNNESILDSSFDEISFIRTDSTGTKAYYSIRSQNKTGIIEINMEKE